MSIEATPQIFYMNDCDWWLAGSLEEAVADYEKETGIKEEEARPVTEEELDRLIYVDTEEDGSPIEERTFREQLVLVIATGETGPCMFASTEY